MEVALSSKTQGKEEEATYKEIQDRVARWTDLPPAAGWKGGKRGVIATGVQARLALGFSQHPLFMGMKLLLPGQSKLSESSNGQAGWCTPRLMWHDKHFVFLLLSRHPEEVGGERNKQTSLERHAMRMGCSSPGTARGLLYQTPGRQKLPHRLC